MACGAISEFADLRNVRRARPEAAVDFAALSFWAWTRRKTAKAKEFTSPSETNGFVTLIVSH